MVTGPAGQFQRGTRQETGQPILLLSSAELAAALTRLAARGGLSWGEVGQQPSTAIGQALQACEARAVALCLEGPCDGYALLAGVQRIVRRGGVVAVLDAAPRGGAEGPVPRTVLREALLRRHGAVVVHSFAELCDIAFAAAALPVLPRGSGVAILTGGGGGGVITADLCAQAGLQVPSLSAETRAALVPLVPSIASTGNPVDLTPEMFTERFYDRFPQVLDVVAADPGIHAVMLPTTFNAPRGNVVAAQVLADFARRAPKPVIVAVAPAADMQQVFVQAATPLVPDPARAALALARLVALGTWNATPQTGAGPASPQDLPTLLRGDGFRVVPDDAQARLALRLIGMRDSELGPVVAIGAGGAYARVLPGFSLMEAPFDAAAAEALLAADPLVRHAQKMQRGFALGPAADALARFAALVARGSAPLILDPVSIGPDGFEVSQQHFTRSAA